MNFQKWTFRSAFRFCKTGLQNNVWQKNDNLFCVINCFVCCNTFSDFDLIFDLKLRSPRAAKDAVKYLYSTIDCFRTAGVSKFQF